MSMYNKFKEISSLLNEKNDTYERIYKLCRDVTNSSKKVIFLLQRIPGLSEEESKEVLESSTKELSRIEQNLIKPIAKELKDIDNFQFHNAYTGGIQEYIEALSFHHFLINGSIITYKEVCSRLSFEESEEELLNFPVLQKDFILGLGDLTGELMRFCIKCVNFGKHDMCYKICDVFRQMNECFSSLGPISQRDVSQKLYVFRTSLNKVEDVCYSLQLRKSEFVFDEFKDTFYMPDNVESFGFD